MRDRAFSYRLRWDHRSILSEGGEHELGAWGASVADAKETVAQVARKGAGLRLRAHDSKLPTQSVQLEVQSR